MAFGHGELQTAGARARRFECLAALGERSCALGGWAAHLPYSRDSLKRYIAAASADFWEVGQIRFVLCTDASDEALGLVDVFHAKRLHRRAEVGVLIDSAQRGKGLAVVALVWYKIGPFHHAMLGQLHAEIYSDHLAAQKAFERAGFAQIGCWKKWVQLRKVPRMSPFGNG